MPEVNALCFSVILCSKSTEVMLFSKYMMQLLKYQADNVNKHNVHNNFIAYFPYIYHTVQQKKVIYKHLGFIAHQYQQFIISGNFNWLVILISAFRLIPNVFKNYYGAE